MRQAFLLGLAGLFILGCQDSSGPKTNPAKPQEPRFDDAGGEVHMQDLVLTAPRGWPRKQPKINFILAEFVLPRAEGDEHDGRLTLSVTGGSLDENIKRWKGQFGGAPQKPHEETFESAGLKITLVDYSGEFTDQRGPGAPAVKRPGYRMIGAIIPINGEMHVIKGYGPEKTMADQAEKIKAFIRSVKKR